MSELPASKMAKTFDMPPEARISEEKLYVVSFRHEIRNPDSRIVSGDEYRCRYYMANGTELMPVPRHE